MEKGWILTDRDTAFRHQDLLSSIFYHVFTGVLVLGFQFITTPYFIEKGYPPYISGLVGFLCVSIPVQLTIIRRAQKTSGENSINDFLGRSIEKPYRIIILVIFTFYVFSIVITPFSIWSRKNIFYWMPTWLLQPFNPESVTGKRLLSAFILTLVIDGLLNPVVEELYWRGYLLKRISRIGMCAPVFNGVLFGIQHFWQPYNYLVIIPYSILLSYLVWSKGDLRPSIIIHCTINCLGALITYIPLLFN